MMNGAANRSRAGGFTVLELLVVVTIILIAGALAIPNFLNIYHNARLQATANDLARLMQEAKITANKQNTICPIQYTSNGIIQEAYIDINKNQTLDQLNEPILPLFQSVAPASGAPSGSGGQPSPYVLSGDSPSGAYDNATTLAFSARGLPCAYNYTSPAVCSTPPAKYFVYYLTENRGTTTAWAAVVVTKSGRTKTVMWNGSTWQ